MTTSNTQLLLSGAYGIYIPKMFCEEMRSLLAVPLTDEQVKDLSDPDNEFYWETWQDVLDNAILIEPGTFKRFYLYQNDDLWAVLEGPEITEE